MERGTHWWSEPPWWAWVLMVAGVLTLVIGLTVVDRNEGDPLSAQEAARLQAAADRAAAADAEETDAAISAALDDLRADGELTMYYIGDSLTEGWNASTPELGYRSVLTERLRAFGPVAAGGDWRAGATLDDMRDVARIPEAVDVAIIELGTNDVGETVDPDAFGAAYTQLVAALAAPAERLICVGVYRDGRFATELDATIRTSCDAVGGTFLSIQDLWQAEEFVDPEGTPAFPGQADGGHPNDAGHAELADRIGSALAAPAS